MDLIKDIFTRYFTKELEEDKSKTVFDLFKWKKVNVLMKDFKTGKVLCDMKDLEFPERYSQNACDIIASKYFIKAGIPNIDHETSMRQVAHRLALFYKESLKDEGLIKTTEEGNIFYDEIVYCLLSQKFAPNSPAWFNVGLNLAYGIKGEPNDQYYYDEKKKRVIKSKDAYTRAQVSACFILSIKDALIGKHSIMENLTSQTKLFKFGSGVGSNYSIIRAKGEKLSGGGKSSGLMSFLKVFDRNAGAIKSGGKNRRSAAMICIDIDHPEIEDFIKWKSREEDKVRALGKMGYDADINGEAYETVSGQNGNNSVRLTDEFMKKVANLDKEPNATITLKGRVDQSINREIKVKDLWEEFNKAIWECADPAPQFDDTFNEWHTCPAGEDGKVGAKYNKISSSNPCLHPECRLLTTSGYIPIGQLEGQTVNIVNAFGDISPSQVWCSGEKEIYKFRLATGKIMRCTGNHIFRTNDGYQSEAKDLKGKRLMPYLNCNYTRIKEWELAGFAQGDGNLTKLNQNRKLSLNIGYKDGDIANYFNLKVHKKIAYLDESELSKREMINILGFSDKALPERELPATIECFGYVERTSFLRGLYSANGSVLSNGRITFKSTCYSLVYDLRNLLWELDISSYITTNRAHMVTFSNGDYMCKESYDLNILRYDDRVKFYNMIGFIQGYKMERLRNLLIEQSPKVMSVVNTHKKEKVYDFTEPLTHWGVVEGYVAHNCGEYAFLDDTSCNLASINVYNFYDPEKQKFDVIGYEHLIHLTQLVLEASINWGQFPTPDIARKTYNFRATGLGISNLASLLMVQGYPYDSEEARKFTSGLVGILTGESYYTSALMAKEIGAFRKYDINKKYMLNVIKKHVNYIKNSVLPENCINLDTYDLLIREAYYSFMDAYKAGQKFGYRNAQVSVMAPTGTISFAMDCGSTSIEPYFSHVAYKKLAGGGGMLITNPVIEQTLKNLNYNDDEIKDISDYIIKNHKIEGAPHLDNVFLSIFDTANKCGDGERYIQPMGHVKMVASITPLISGAISKTVNLPREATIDDFKEVILESWRMGVKGITLYRDGSKAAQPLNSTNDKSIKKNEELTYKELLDKVNYYESNLDKSKQELSKDEEIDLLEDVLPMHKIHISDNTTSLKNEEINSNKPIRKKMNGIRTGTTHPAIVDGVKIYTTVNRKPTGEIGEIYVTTDREGSIITGLLNSISKTISVMLQYGIDPRDISKMFRGQKYEPYGFVQNHPYIKSVDSISDLISKVIDIELGDFSRCQVKPSKTVQAEYLLQNGMDFKEVAKNLNTTNTDKTKKMKPIEDDKSTDKIIKGYEKESNAFQKEEKVYGKTCPNCGSTRMLRNGTCYVCRDCGSTTGCS